MYNQRELPIGIQDFEKLRTENYLYVDKTEYLYRLSRTSKPYFLSRPRRFGKSLFLSSLKAFFEGKKELFQGLKVYDLEQDWIEYPVFHMEFLGEEYNSLENFHSKLDDNLTDIEAVWGKSENGATFSRRLKNAIMQAYNKSGKRKVVVLVDEYDKPLLESIGNQKLNEEIRASLKAFYSVLKAMDGYLRFVFLTGVTKFSQVSIFSDLNQLRDISLDKKFADICGISERELVENFQPEIEILATETEKTYEETLAKLKRHYDGYHFANQSDGVYNPFSVLNTFDANAYRNYWFATGTPTFLTKIIQKTGFDIQTLEKDIRIPASSIMDYRADSSSLVPLLYQSGYLTIKDYKSDRDTYILGFPNEEVKYGFLNELIPAYAPKWGLDLNFSTIQFLEYILDADVENFMQNLKAFYASIPYDMETKENKDERYYQFIFYLLFKLMGQFVETEVKTAAGRADAVVKTDKEIYVFEFKMDTNATAEQALQQIDDKNYLIPYTTDGRKLVKIGIAFSEEARGISEWKIV
jgi:hypothetical protein